MVDGKEPDLVVDDDDSLADYYSDTPLDPQPRYPPMDNSFDSAIVVTNIPRVTPDRVEKLTKLLRKIFGNSKIGTLGTSDDGESFTGIFMPTDKESGMTCGFAFVQYTAPQEALMAVKTIQGYALDKRHVLQTTLYSEAMKIRELPDEFVEPTPPPYTERPDTTKWLMDSNQRDAFVIRHGNDTTVLWNDGKNDPVVDYDGEREKQSGINWCDFYCQWSPKGSLLATLIPAKGVILWGGERYEKLGRFPSPGVQFVMFSPQENFLLTSNMNRNDPAAIKIFDVQTQKLLRNFPLYPQQFLTEDQQKELKRGHFETVPPPPPFQWSYDDCFLARMGKNLISVYDTATMKLLNQRSLDAHGIEEFQFSPRDPIIAYWAPELPNTPAQVSLIELPTRKLLRQKNLFNVTKCSMAWQAEGDFFGVKVTRHTKSKKTLFNNIELFRIRDAGVPIEMLEVKDAVMAFAWEPRGSRFAMIHAENPSSTKVNVSFYDMNKEQDVATVSTAIGKKKKQETKQIVGEVNKIETLEGKQCNSIFWSPAGGVIIMASLGESASGTLEFYDVESKTLSIKEHYRCNEVLWDPSGRTVATCVVQPIGGGHFKFSMDNGYILWTFQGKQMYQKSFETFFQLQWRPRERLLPKSEVDKVVKNLRNYEKRFDKEDKERERKRYIEETRGKRKLRDEFRQRLARLREFRDRQKETRIELLDGYDSDDERNYVMKEVTVETLLSTKDEIIYL